MAEKLLFLQKELRKGIIVCIVYIHNMFEFDASGNKQKQNKKRNKDWYWNVETPKKKQKQNIDCFYWGIFMGVLKLRQIKESRVLIKLYFFLFLQISQRLVENLSVSAFWSSVFS